jgi:circadian clock protein KaiC
MTEAIKTLKMHLPKFPTGIQGLDEITNGGIPQGRPTLVCGSAGCGKTLFGVEFLVYGAVEYKESVSSFSMVDIVLR